MPMTPEAKQALSKTIRGTKGMPSGSENQGLRQRLLADLHDATEWDIYTSLGTHFEFHFSLLKPKNDEIDQVAWSNDVVLGCRKILTRSK